MGLRLSSLGAVCHRNAFACLLFSYILFVVLGGLMFSAVEMPVEKALRVEAEDLRRSFLQENPCVREKRLMELLEKALTAHEQDVAVLEADGKERHDDFTTALYFVIVSLTTMGSDSFSPSSDEAKLFCVFYCGLGIPLTLFLLTLLSNLLLLPVLTDAPLRHLRSYWGLPYARAGLVHSGLLLALVVCFLFLVPALLVSLLEPDWSFLDAFFFCFVILSTVGQGGGSSLGRNWSPAAKAVLELFTTFYLLLGLVVIITLKETVLQVPQVRAVIRLFSGPQHGELEGFHLNQLVLNQQNSEESRYAVPICTISSTPLDLKTPFPDQTTTQQPHKQQQPPV